MIGFLLTIVSLLLSPFGLMALLAGIVSFFLLPFIPRVTNRFHAFARFHQTLAGMILKRAAIVVSEHGDLLLKRMSYDDAGVEMISFSDTDKEFEDSSGAKSWWLGMRFGLANEKHGFFFTPVDAALGRRKKEADEADEIVAKATAEEQANYDVMGWIRGVFEFPKGVYEIVDLNNVRYIITGDERAEQPQKVKKFYELSQEPYSDRKTAIQLFLLLAAAIGPFAMVWILYSQLSGPTSSVSFGAYLVLFGGVSLGISRNGLKTVLVYLTVLLPVPLVTILIAVLVSPVVAGALLVLALIGFIIVPIFTQILKISDRAASAMAGMLLKLGFMGYETPVLECTPSGYKTREFQNLSNVSQEHVSWHTFLNRKFGFTFTPDESVWGNEVVPKDDIENTSEMVTDGGKMAENGQRKVSGTKTNIPPGYTRVPERSRAVYGDFVPTRLSRNSYYVAVGRALSRFAHVATGQKSHNRLGRAKEEFGGGSGFEQRTVAMLMAALSLVSLFLGVLVFIVPSLL